VTLATFGLVTVVQSCTTLHKSRKDFCKNTDVNKDKVETMFSVSDKVASISIIVRQDISIRCSEFSSSVADCAITVYIASRLTISVVC
jgi:hypothetical protein